MLLHRLREYALQHPDAAPFHRQRGFSWRLSLDVDGQPLSRELQPISEPGMNGKPRPVPHTVPTAVRTVGVAPNLAADDVQYVLGWADESSKASRVAECHAAFVDLVYRWAGSAEGLADPIAQAVAAFYRNDGPDKIDPDPDRPFTAKDGVLIMVGGDPAYRGHS
ncbi:MAG: type I-C CRISPR-associated protein Cas8c/Csd1, partial [Sciscionella sp.]